MLNIQNIFDQSNKRNYICIKLKTQNDINMRRIITMICLIVAGYTQVSAQQLYKKVYDNAIAVVNNAKSTDEQIQINQFKVTAMNYMTSQIKKSGKEQDSYFYDSQAVNMASFITDFETNVMKARAMSTAKRLQVIEIYRDALLTATSMTKLHSPRSALTPTGKKHTKLQHRKSRNYSNKDIPNRMAIKSHSVSFLSRHDKSKRQPQQSSHLHPFSPAWRN